MNEKQQLQNAISLLQQKKTQSAYEILKALHISNAKTAQVNAQLEYFLGAALHQLGQIFQALPHFAAAASTQPENPQLRRSFVQVSKEALNTHIAKKDFKAVIALKGNIALLNSEQTFTHKVLGLEDCIAIDLLFAKAYRLQENYTAALDLLEKYHPENNKNAFLVHDYALCLRLNGQANKAIKYYESLIDSGMVNPVLFQNYANALSDKGDYPAAITWYTRVLQQQVFNVDVLSNIIDALWESAQHEHMYHLIDTTMAIPACPVFVYRLFFDKLMRIQAAEKAANVLQKMQSAYGVCTQSSYCELMIKHHVLEPEIVVSMVDDLFTHDDLATPEKLELIQVLIANNKTSAAKNYLIPIIKNSPSNQLGLALAHTLFRLGEPIEHPVSQLEDYVFEYKICDPLGNREPEAVETFLKKLQSTLLKMHTAENQPIAQSVHEGTQTRGHLFATQDRDIAHVQSQYKLAVKEYLTNIKKLPALYPGFWDNADIDFSGSWSVLLHKSGFHNNHIHSKGWLSSAFYVALPTQSDTSDTGSIQNNSKEGWFQYGQPKLQSKTELLPSSYVEPVIGKIVIFPSCLWHGTVPFNHGSQRLTIACDIVKKA